MLVADFSCLKINHYNIVWERWWKSGLLQETLCQRTQAHSAHRMHSGVPTKWQPLTDTCALCCSLSWCFWFITIQLWSVTVLGKLSKQDHMAQSETLELTWTNRLLWLEIFDHVCLYLQGCKWAARCWVRRIKWRKSTLQPEI